MDKYENIRLKNQLCFPLYAGAKEIVRKYKPFLDEIELTYTQYISMMVMWELRTINVKELGQCLYLDSGTLTPLLKKLEDKGYITRTRSKTDERNLCVEITDKGDNLKEKAVEIQKQIGTCIPLTHEESIQLYHLLYKLLGEE